MSDVPISPGDLPTPEQAAAAADKWAQAQIDAELIHYDRDQAMQGVTVRGAPMDMRIRVANAATPEQADAIMRGYAPDATLLPGATDNWVYTDPTSGEKTVFRHPETLPQSLDELGQDVAANAPGLAAQTVGGVVGGLAGGELAGPPGAYAGSVTGMTAAQHAVQQAVRAYYGDPETRTPFQIGRDVATDVGVNAVGEGAARLVTTPLLRAYNALRPGASDALDAARDLSHINPDLAPSLPAGIATGSTGVQRLESGFAQAPGDSVQSAYREANQQLVNTADEIASRVAGNQPVPSSDTFGGTISQTARAAVQRVENTRQALEDNALNLIGRDTPVDLDPLRDLQTNLQARLTRSGGADEPQVRAALDEVNRVLDAANQSPNPGSLPFDVVNNARKTASAMLDQMKSPITDKPQTGIDAMRDLYNRYASMQMDTAQSVSPEAGGAWGTHNALVSAYRNDPTGTGSSVADLLGDLSDPSTSSRRLLQLAKGTDDNSATSVLRLAQLATPDQRNALASGLVAQLGRDDAGNFSPARFIKDWSSVSAPQRAALFADPASQGFAQDLDRLVNVAQGYSRSTNLANHSNTAGAFYLLNTGANALSELFAGSPVKALQTAAGATGMVGAGGLLESRPMIQWLTTAMLPGTAQNWGGFINRGYAIAAANPVLREPIQHAIDALTPDKLGQVVDQSQAARSDLTPPPWPTYSP